MQLRDYQIECVQKCAEALREHNTALLVLGTGAGKSVILAAICKRILERNPTWRILVLCYIQEVLESNKTACTQLGVDSGIYCAGSGQRDTHQRVIHASRDSLASNLEACGRFNVILVDECHAIPDFVKGDGKRSRYQSLIEFHVPRYIVGVTATPFRLDGGYIFGRRKLFKNIAYELGSKELIERGFLVPFRFPTIAKQLDTSGIKVVRGDFDNKQLEERLLRDEKLVVESIKIWQEHAKDRRCSLFFCHSVAHAQMCLAIFKRLMPNVPAAYLDGETKKNERLWLIESIKDGKFKAVFQINTMTTGTNLPIIDCIVWLRPTLSPVLYIQGCGRGSRLYPGKDNCLVIDPVGNIETFGSVTKPTINARSATRKLSFDPKELAAMGLTPELIKGESPVKTCVACKVELHAAAKKCDQCGQLQLKEHNLVTEEYELTKVTVFHNCVTYTNSPAIYIEYYCKTSKGFKLFKEILRKDLPWLRQTIQTRLQVLQEPVSHLQVRRNDKSPSHPLVRPVLKPGFSVSVSHISKSMVCSAGVTTQPEYSTLK